MPQGFKQKKSSKPSKKVIHQQRKHAPKMAYKAFAFVNKRADGTSTKEINHGIEAQLVGRVITSQEKLKLVDKTLIRNKQVIFANTMSGRAVMKEGRNQKIKVKLNRNGP